MNNTLAELICEAESLGIFNEDVNELNLSFRGQKLTGITINSNVQFPDYNFWTKYSEGLDIAIDLTDEEKIYALQEIIAWY